MKRRCPQVVKEEGWGGPWREDDDGATTVRRGKRARAQVIPVQMGRRQGGGAQHPPTTGRPTLAQNGTLDA